MFVCFQDVMPKFEFYVNTAGTELALNKEIWILHLFISAIKGI